MKNKFDFLIIPLIALTGLVLAWIFYAIGKSETSNLILLITLVIGVLPLIWGMFGDIFRGHFGVDLIAITAIVCAFFLQQYLAGAVIVLMLSGGEALEAYALRRARRELSALISNAPSVAHIKQGDKVLDVKAKDVKIGDIIVIKAGEIAPVDGVVTFGQSLMDEGALTGESLPVEKHPGSPVLSGSVNKETVLEVKALKASSESKYEQIIRLVKEAEESRAPMVRLADRYAVWFTVITFVLAAFAWFISHDPIRLLAVLVVATPCPLILATPIAMISGISKAASRGIIIKNGGALETLAQVKAFIFDKTGTLTLGKPDVVGVETVDSTMEKDVVRLAASLDQLSTHILAVSLTEHASKKLNLQLDYPENFKEFFGDGVIGEIKNSKYFFGKLSFIEKQGANIPAAIRSKHEQVQNEGKISVYLAQDKQLIGAVYFADVVRPEIKKLFYKIKMQGIKHVVMLTGDKQIVADKIAKQVGLDDIHAEALPEDKVREVKDHQKQFGLVAMIGDGVNDAPALSAADVGIAMGAHGSTASADTGDIVITVDNLERVGEAYTLSKRVLHIAKQGIFVGMAVSILLMLIASFGGIKPVYGAVLQELLDVAVILNALRVNFEKIV